jgi:PKD repeat protein
VLTCDFDGSDPTDDGTIVSHEWEFDDGATDTGVQTQHVYAADGADVVHLTVPLPFWLVLSM